MLPSAQRLRSSADFSTVLGQGRRARTPRLSVHLLPGSAGRPARAGLVVSAKVGNSVVRHQVSRRLRAQLRPVLATLPAGTDVVVRAFPVAADASSAVLAADLTDAVRRCHR